MNILVAVNGLESQTFYDHLAILTPLKQADRVLLVHVVDEGPREHLDRGRNRFLDHRRLSAEREHDLERAEAESAQAALMAARSALEATGLPGERLEELVLRGRPNEVIRDLAEREGADLLVVGARPGKPGPHSVGKTARFLIDHCPVAAMLVRW